MSIVDSISLVHWTVESNPTAYFQSFFQLVIATSAASVHARNLNIDGLTQSVSMILSSCYAWQSLLVHVSCFAGYIHVSCHIQSAVLATLIYRRIDHSLTRPTLSTHHNTSTFI